MWKTGSSAALKTFMLLLICILLSRQAATEAFIDRLDSDAEEWMLIRRMELVRRDENSRPPALPEEPVSLFKAELPFNSRPEDRAYEALVWRNDEWYESAFWSGKDWTRVGRNWQHTGNETPSVRCFIAPRGGHVTISGRVYKADIKSGDGIHAEIRHGADILWQKDIDAADDKGVSHDISCDVKKGDRIRFVLHKRGSITCDTTWWDPCLVYEDGARFKASESFSDKTDGVWRYEALTGGNRETAYPDLYWLDRDGFINSLPLSPGIAGALTEKTAQPVLMLTDEKKESGFLLKFPALRQWTFNAGTEEDALSLNLESVVSRPLPDCSFIAFEGGPETGFSLLKKLPLEEDFKELKIAGDPVFSFLIEEAWRLEDGSPDCTEDWNAAVERHLEKARLLLDDLRREHGADFLTDRAGALDRLASAPASADPLTAKKRYLAVRRLKREIVLANPLMQFGPLLFCKRVPTSYSHLVMQYYGWRARPGGGLYILKDPGRSLETRDILEDRLPPGNILEPRLSFDGRQIVFSYVACPDGPRDPREVSNEKGGAYYHIYSVNTDGTGLRQLTDAGFDDVMPAWLPDGGIAFCSTRRRGYARCFGTNFSDRWDTYTLHRMDSDGGNIRTLSWNDVNEWFPTVSNDGRILYARWDYIDRDAVTHQNLWASRPDGTNPVAVWGNATPSPHCTFQMKPVPDSLKIIFVASAHHSITAGSLVLLDPAAGVDGEAALTRITPDVSFPEAETRDIREYYTSPWPLSEKYYLTAYSPWPLVWEPGANRENALGIYALDIFGNRELLYRDREIGATNPCPLRPSPVPPVIPDSLPANAPPLGEVYIADVQHGPGEDIPPETIREIRIVQIFPKSTPLANQPPIGMAGEENGRAILGTVPVEKDGSARFLVPADKPFLFQILDEKGFAWQTMRSLTYLKPGEKVSCSGCHENRLSAPPNSLASVRPPSRIRPEFFGKEPFSYMRMVQPVLDKHCAGCHEGEDAPKGIDLTGRPEKAFTASYLSLCGDVDFRGAGTNPENAEKALVPRFGARNQVQVTPPGGIYGARGSRLMKMLLKGHNDVELTEEEIRRIAAWIDCNAIFYGINDPEAQKVMLAGGSSPMPDLQ